MSPPLLPTRCPTSPIIFWKWILIKMTHQSGQLFLKEETKWDQKQLKAIRLAVSFLSNCILKIIIFNPKYMQNLQKSQIIFFKLILLENDTANHFAFTTQFPQRTSSLRGSCSLWCVFLKKILMPVGLRAQ